MGLEWEERGEGAPRSADDSGILAPTLNEIGRHWRVEQRREMNYTLQGLQITV